MNAILKYSIGIIKNISNPAIPFLTKIDGISIVSKKSHISRSCQIFQSIIGRRTYVTNNTSIVCAKIGSFCSIGHNCSIGLAVHTLNKISSSPVFTEKHNPLRFSFVNEDKVVPYKPVNIGNDVWIGDRALVMGGVSVGNGAVIGAGAVVTKDVPPYAIVVGVPAKVIRYRFPEDIRAKLEELKWWNMPERYLKEHISLFHKENITMEELETLLK